MKIMIKPIFNIGQTVWVTDTGTTGLFEVTQCIVKGYIYLGPGKGSFKYILEGNIDNYSYYDWQIFEDYNKAMANCNILNGEYYD